MSIFEEFSEHSGDEIQRRGSMELSDALKNISLRYPRRRYLAKRGLDLHFEKKI
jgi:stage V sporulation protein SpoVS